MAFDCPRRQPSKEGDRMRRKSSRAKFWRAPAEKGSKARQNRRKYSIADVGSTEVLTYYRVMSLGKGE